MKELSGRVAVVTGGASGIGRGMAKAFAAEGMKLVLADIEGEPLAKAVAELTTSGASVIGALTDVTKPEALEELRDQTLSEYGAAHVLCNNAGVGGSGAGPLWALPQDEWDWVMGVNLNSVVYGIRSFVPAMLEQGDEGHIVNTASLAGLIHGAGIYGITKQAVVALSESLWAQLAPTKLGVSVLCPGWVRTRIVESERNRPEGPRPDPGPAAELAEAGRAWVAERVENGLDPVEVGKLVADSMRENRFYVLTHLHWNHMIENRMRTILEQRDPIGTPPPDK